MRPVLLLVLIVTAAVLQPAAAQRPMPRPRPGPEIPTATPVPRLPPADAPQVPVWLSLGIGPSTASPRGEGMANVGLRMTVPLGVGAVVLDAGAMAATELFIFGSNESVIEGHVAAGLAGRRGSLVGSVVAGPAFVRVSAFEPVRGPNRLVGRSYLGAFGSAQVIAALSRTVGLGAEAFGVLNAGHPTGGLRLFVAVGALR